MFLIKKIFKILEFFEYLVTYFQGKGFGSNTTKQEVRLISFLLKDRVNLMVDIGGNKGEYSSHFRQKFPNSKIYIFEPAQSNIDILIERFKKDSKTTIIPFAVSDSNGLSYLYSDQAGSPLGSLIKRDLQYVDISFGFREEVRTIQFQDFWSSDLRGQKIDIVKLDIEGTELSALQSFGSALKHISLIQFEFGGCNIDTRTNFKDFYDFFTKFDFSIYRITPIGLQHISRYRVTDEFYSTTNYFALSKKI